MLLEKNIKKIAGLFIHLLRPVFSFFSLPIPLSRSSFATIIIPEGLKSFLQEEASVLEVWLLPSYPPTLPLPGWQESGGDSRKLWTQPGGSEARDQATHQVRLSLLLLLLNFPAEQFSSNPPNAMNPLSQVCNARHGLSPPGLHGAGRGYAEEVPTTGGLAPTIILTYYPTNLLSYSPPNILSYSYSPTIIPSDYPTLLPSYSHTILLSYSPTPGDLSQRL